LSESSFGGHNGGEGDCARLTRRPHPLGLLRPRGTGLRRYVLARASGWCFRVSGSCFCGNFLSARLWPRRTCALRAGALGVKRSFQLGRLSMAAESWRDDGVRRSGETSKSRGKRALECPGRPERAGARRSSCREWHGIFVRRAEMGRPNRRQKRDKEGADKEMRLVTLQKEGAARTRIVSTYGK